MDVAPSGVNSKFTTYLLRAALTYARRGIPVFPCTPGGKEPLTKNGFKDASTHEHKVHSWWTRWPHANIAVPTGKASGILVLDEDGETGAESLSELEEKHAPLPVTAATRTGRGGKHRLFRYPAGETIRNSAGKLGPGLDVRAEGGYFEHPRVAYRGCQGQAPRL